MTLPETEDAFDFFGLSPDVDAVTLKRAYVRLVRQYKPEHHPTEFQRIREMYERASNAVAWESAAFNSGEKPSVPDPEEPPSPAPPSGLNEQVTRVWRLFAAGERANAISELEGIAREAGESPWVYVHGYLLHTESGDAAVGLAWLAQALERGVPIVALLVDCLPRAELLHVAGSEVMRWENLARQPNDFKLGVFFSLRVQALLLAGCVSESIRELDCASFRSAALDNAMLASARERVWTVACIFEDREDFGHDDSFDDVDVRSGFLAEDAWVVRRWLHILPPALRFWAHVGPAIDPDFLQSHARAVVDEIQRGPVVVLDAIRTALDMRSVLPAVLLLRHPEYEPAYAPEGDKRALERGRAVVDAVRAPMERQRYKNSALLGVLIIAFVVGLFYSAPTTETRGAEELILLAIFTVPFLVLLTLTGALTRGWLRRTYNRTVQGRLLSAIAQEGAHPSAVSQAFKEQVNYDLFQPMQQIQDIMASDTELQLAARIVRECGEVLGAAEDSTDVEY